MDKLFRLGNTHFLTISLIPSLIKLLARQKSYPMLKNLKNKLIIKM